MTIIVRKSKNILSPLRASSFFKNLENLVPGGDGLLYWVAKYRNSFISGEMKVWRKGRRAEKAERKSSPQSSVRSRQSAIGSLQSSVGDMQFSSQQLVIFLIGIKRLHERKKLAASQEN